MYIYIHVIHILCHPGQALVPQERTAVGHKRCRMHNSLLVEQGRDVGQENAVTDNPDKEKYKTSDFRFPKRQFYKVLVSFSLYFSYHNTCQYLINSLILTSLFTTEVFAALHLFGRTKDSTHMVWFVSWHTWSQQCFLKWWSLRNTHCDLTCISVRELGECPSFTSCCAYKLTLLYNWQKLGSGFKSYWGNEE